MNLLKQLWDDESGAVYSAEAVVLGSVVLTGATVGFSQLNTAINAELEDMSAAIRSLDQSYSIPGHEGANGAMTAGSSFTDNVAEDVQSVTAAPEEGEAEEEQPSNDDLEYSA